MHKELSNVVSDDHVLIYIYQLEPQTYIINIHQSKPLTVRARKKRFNLQISIRATNNVLIYIYQLETRAIFFITYQNTNEM